MSLRLLSVGGVALFLTLGLVLMLSQGGFLTYPVSWAGGLILAIETAATLGIAATLLLALLGGEPESWLPANSSAAPLPASAESQEENHSC